MPERTLRLEIDVDAPLAVVWRLMTDFDGYSAWNPFVVEAAAPAGASVGALLHLRVRWPNGREQRVRERFTSWDPPSPTGAGFAYAYVGHLSTLGLVRARREQTLVPLGPARCRYTTTERFTGLLAGLAPLVQVHEGFEAQARALRRICRARGAGSGEDREPAGGTP